MKKAFILAFALGLLPLGISDLKAESLIQKEDIPVFVKVSEDNNAKEAESETMAAVEEMVNNTTTQRKVKFCNNSGFVGQDGSGYAEVTLKDGSVHYTHYSWFKDSLGKVQTAAVYLGTSNLPYMGC